MARFIWTEKLLFKAAQAHKSKSEFKSAFPSGYAAARRMGILEVICDHMNAKIKPSGYWKDLNNLKREARKYKTRTDFAHNSQGAYSIAKRLGVLDDICEHMILKGNRYYRAIYVFEFKNKSAYVGLSYDIEKRKISHLKGSGPVGRAAKKCKFRFKQLTEYVPRKQAKKLEHTFLRKYQADGWLILNTAKAGALGAGEKLTIDFLKSEIKKYDTLKEFAENSPSAYATAKNRKLHKLFAHLKRSKRLDGTLSKRHCTRIAKKCISRSIFKKQFPSEYSTSVRKGWLDSICKHMDRPTVHNFKYDYRRCAEEAAKCSNATEFRTRFPGAFGAAHKNGWYEKITGNFIRLNASPVNWTFEKCLKKAKLFKSKAEFRINEYNAYKYACKHKFLARIEYRMGWKKKKAPRN